MDKHLLSGLTSAWWAWATPGLLAFAIAQLILPVDKMLVGPLLLRSISGEPIAAAPPLCLFLAGAE